jgi:hypothetical protein
MCMKGSKGGIEYRWRCCPSNCCVAAVEAPNAPKIMQIYTSQREELDGDDDGREGDIQRRGLGTMEGRQALHSTPGLA